MSDVWLIPALVLGVVAGWVHQQWRLRVRRVPRHRLAARGSVEMAVEALRLARGGRVSVLDVLGSGDSEREGARLRGED